MGLMRPGHRIAVHELQFCKNSAFFFLAPTRKMGHFPREKVSPINERSLIVALIGYLQQTDL